MIHRTRASLLLGITAAFLVNRPAPAGPPDHSPAATAQDRTDRLGWWRDARFGLFVHWGPVSLKGTEISWSRANSNPAHPNKGPIPVDVYDNLYKQFNPTRFDAQQWVAIAQAAGMKYVVLTAKHCDGFCLWNSGASAYNVMNTPLRRDVCAELAAAARQAGLRIGWYYSPMDWRDPDCRTERNATYIASMQEQLRELLSNYGRIDLLWFDTDGNPAPWDQARNYRQVRGLQPQIIINNRLDLGSMASYNAMPIAPQADYYTPEQRIGEYDDQRPWETCMTLGTQWSWKPQDQIKSVSECIRILAQCAGGDGNLLLNVGPMPTGEIEPRQVEVLKGIGKWLERNGESIHGTRGGPFKPTEAIASTRRGNFLYVHVLHAAGRTIVLPAVSAQVVASSLLDGTPVAVRQAEGSLKLTLPESNRAPCDTVVKLTLDRPAASIGPMDIASAAAAKAQNNPAQAKPERPQVAVYYFPNYHPGDPSNTRMKGAAWSEWELVKAARPRFPGHAQPKVPLWGYVDESDPAVMARKIDAAADHGVDAFIFDWYFYDTGPFLNDCLDRGYLKALNRGRVKFGLMWANHDWLDLHPYKKGSQQKLLFPGKVSPQSFERITDHVIRDYFSEPSYWKIDGKPYFSFYDLSRLVENFGSVPATRGAGPVSRSREGRRTARRSPQRGGLGTAGLTGRKPTGQSVTAHQGSRLRLGDFLCVDSSRSVAPARDRLQRSPRRLQPLLEAGGEQLRRSVFPECLDGVGFEPARQPGRRVR